MKSVCFEKEFPGTKTTAVAAGVGPRDCGLCHMEKVKEFALFKNANTIDIVRCG